MNVGSISSPGDVQAGGSKPAIKRCLQIEPCPSTSATVSPLAERFRVGSSCSFQTAIPELLRAASSHCRFPREEF
jgi:hypothetical protein